MSGNRPDPDVPFWDKGILFQSPDTFSTNHLNITPATIPAPGSTPDGTPAPGSTPLAPEHLINNVKSLFFQGPDFKDKPTHIFAWYGIPDSPGNQKIPGMVLLHGGGGTAMADWVALWNQRGYAAIAIDTNGHLPIHENGYWKPNPHGGPECWESNKTSFDDPVTDHWSYQAVSAVTLANSLLRSFKQVDEDRIGITGVSWGAYLSLITACVDDRFRFCAPVYGSGFLDELELWQNYFTTGETRNIDKWMTLWDASNFLPQITMPMLWLSGTNDHVFPMDILQKSYRIPKSPRSLCIKIDMCHGHWPGQIPEEIHVFANHYLKNLKNDKPLHQITAQGFANQIAWATYESQTQIVKAQLTYTCETCDWKDRKWLAMPAQIDAGKSRVSARVPDNCQAHYLNLTDSRDLVISTEHTPAPGS